jgi:hypothetical protein
MCRHRHKVLPCAAAGAHRKFKMLEDSQILIQVSGFQARASLASLCGVILLRRCYMNARLRETTKPCRWLHQPRQAHITHRAQ